MQTARSLRRSVLLVLSLLSACAAAQPTVEDFDPSAPLEITTASGAQLIARHAVAVGEMDVAAQAFDRLLRTEPNNVDLIRQAFLTSLLSGRAGALALAHRLPQFPAAELLIADDDARHDRWQQAEKEYAGLPRQGAFDIMRPLLVAWSAAGAGDYGRALDILKPLTTGQRFRAMYLLHSAMIADLAGRDAQADSLFRQAATDFGLPNLPLLRQQTSFLARHGQAAEAEAMLRKMAATNQEIALSLPGLMRDMQQRQIRRATDGLAEVYTAFAAALRGQNNSDLSRVLLRLALNLRPDLTSARLLSAEMSSAEKHPAEALQTLAPVGDDDPLLPLVQVRRALIDEQMGHTEDALATLAKVEAALPDRPEPVVMQADILRQHKRWGEAVTAYDKAIKLSGPPSRANWALLYYRAIALDRDHQWNRAEADLLQALQLSPDQPAVLNYLGYSWTEQGRNLDRAREMIERAVAQRPDDGAIADSLGWLSLRQGKVAEAVTQLERAADLEPNDATINMHLGDAYWAAGRKLDAQFQWRRAMTLDPEPADKAKLEAKLAEGAKALGLSADPAAPATKLR